MMCLPTSKSEKKIFDQIGQNRKNVVKFYILNILFMSFSCKTFKTEDHEKTSGHYTNSFHQCHIVLLMVNNIQVRLTVARWRKKTLHNVGNVNWVRGTDILLTGHSFHWWRLHIMWQYAYPEFQVPSREIRKCETHVVLKRLNNFNKNNLSWWINKLSQLLKKYYV